MTPRSKLIAVSPRPMRHTGLGIARTHRAGSGPEIRKAAKRNARQPGSRITSAAQFHVPAISCNTPATDAGRTATIKISAHTQASSRASCPPASTRALARIGSYTTISRASPQSHAPAGQDAHRKTVAFIHSLRGTISIEAACIPKSRQPDRFVYAQAHRETAIGRSRRS